MSIFTKVAMKKVPRNTFNLNHSRKMSLDFGRLVPFLVMDVVPNDIVTIRSHQMIRFAPMVAPVMHRVKVYQHYFFVPNRILWDNWEGFITGGEDGNDASVAPYIDINNPEEGSLADYLGVPSSTGFTADHRISALPFAAYQEIYAEYYRDQNLQSATTQMGYDCIDGDNTAAYTAGTIGVLRSRAWQHDYFTSALPWTQKGPEATIPLGTTASLDVHTGTGLTNITTSASGIGRIAGTSFGPDDVTFTGPGTYNTIQATGANAFIDVSNNTFVDPAKIDVDLSTAAAASINDLRTAFRLQEWLEKNARGGSRYTEFIYVHFGVKSPDARLQRPEYLGGSAQDVQFSEVLQTSANASEPTPQGNMAGHGISVGSSGRNQYRVQEHGYIIGIMSVMPKSGYFQGMPRHLTRWDRFDYYFPTFANLGEQPILNQEVYYDPDDGDNELTFGYTPRYAEYKYIPGSVHGQFRSSLNFWHLDRVFATRPALNSAFIRMQSTECDRIFAVTDPEDQKLYAFIWNDVKASRPMPYFGTPRI